MFKSDPDVIIGHDFLGVTLDVLLTRMKELKVDNWSRISRFRRKKMPNIGRQGTNLKFLYGRLLCDLSSDGAKASRSFAKALKPPEANSVLEYDFFYKLVSDRDVRDSSEECSRKH